MPLLNIVLNANPIDLLREVAQKIRVIGPARRLAHSRQVYREASEVAAKALDDIFPETTTGRHSMNEEYGNSGTATYKVHEGAPILLMRLHTPG
jgi:1-acyl-sn-glycerol-3-phosphate acyltransferase